MPTHSLFTSHGIRPSPFLSKHTSWSLVQFAVQLTTTWKPDCSLCRKTAITNPGRGRAPPLWRRWRWRLVAALLAWTTVERIRGLVGLKAPQRHIGPGCFFVSFAGGGWLSLYNLGVVRYLLENRSLLPKYKVTGVSVGAWMGLLYVYLRELPDGEWQKEYDIICDRGFRLSNKVRDTWMRERLTFIDQATEVLLKPYVKAVLPHCDGQYFVPVTEVVGPHRGLLRYRVESRFRDAAHLEELVACSSSIPGVQDWPMRKYLDGGFLNNLPRFGACTVRVHWAWFGAAEIKPQRDSLDYTLLNIVKPPTNDFINALLDTGYKDAQRFFGL